MFATESSHSILSIGIETEKREWCVSSMIDERSNEKQILLEKDQSYGRRITLGEHTRSVGVEETV